MSHQTSDFCIAVDLDGAITVVYNAPIVPNQSTDLYVAIDLTCAVATDDYSALGSEKARIAEPAAPSET